MKKKIMYVVMFLAISTIFINCGDKESVSSSEDKTITIGLPIDPITLDPPMYSEIVTHNVNLVLYNRLYDLSEDGILSSDLAVDMPLIEENGTKYTIKIRENVKFHNGNGLTIDDVIFSFTRGAFHEKSQMKSIYAMMYDLKKIDDYTFSFRTGTLPKDANVKNKDLKTFEARTKYYKPTSFGSQVNQLSWLGSSILDKETMEAAEADGSIKDYGATWAQGTGPYMFESWSQGDNITLTRFTNYFNYSKDSNVEKLVFKTIKDPSALKTAFITKEVDVLAAISPLDASEIEKQGGKILTPTGFYGYHYLSFNMKSPRVGQVNADGSADLDGEYDLTSDQTKLRMAIIYAVNPADINNSIDIMNKKGQITRQFIISLPFGKITETAGTRLEEGNDETGYYNPEKAREIFASLPDELKKPGSLKLTVRADTVFLKEAIVIKDQVKKILGVDLITIQQVALAEIITRRSISDPNVWDLYVGDTSTDDSYYIFVAYNGFDTSVGHDTKYYDKKAQELIERGNMLPNGPERDEAYRMASIEILKAMPRLPLVAARGLSASQPTAESVKISPSGSLMLDNIIKK